MNASAGNRVRQKAATGRRCGVVLVSTVFMLVTASVLGFAAMVVLSGSMTSRVLAGKANRAYYLAESGAEFVKSELWQDVAALPNTTVTLDGGDQVAVTTQSITDGLRVVSVGTVNPGSAHETRRRVTFLLMFPVPFSPFAYGIYAKGLIEFSGGVIADSFDSSDPTKSTNGQYDPNKATEDATLGTLSTDDPAFSANGSGSIQGDISVAPGGTIDLIGGFQVTGDQTFDADAEIPDVDIPIATTVTDPGITANTTITVAGDVDMGVATVNLSGTEELTVTGEGVLRLYVDGEISLTGQSLIRVTPSPAGADLSAELYANGSVSISGVGVVNETGYAANFAIYGTENCLDFDYSGQADYLGIIYAPYAEVKVTGQGGITGAVVADSVKYSGQGDFHFDESLYDFTIGEDGTNTVVERQIQY